MKLKMLSVLQVFVLGLAACAAHARDLSEATESVPRALPYEGHLAVDGVPLNGTVELTFSLWATPDVVAGAQSLFEQTQQVRFVNGKFSVMLGEGNVGLSQVIFDADALYVGVAVGPTTLAGRQRIVAVPYALWAAKAADFTVANDLAVGGNATVSNDLAVGFDAAIGRDLAVGLNATVSNDLAVGLNATVSNDLAVGGNATMARDLAVGGTTVLFGESQFRGPATVNGLFTASRSTFTGTVDGTDVKMCIGHTACVAGAPSGCGAVTCPAGKFLIMMQTPTQCAGANNHSGTCCSLKLVREVNGVCP